MPADTSFDCSVSDRVAPYTLRQPEQRTGGEPEFERRGTIDDAGGGEAVLLLELLESRFGPGPEDAVDATGYGDALIDERLLDRSHGIAACPA